VPESAVGEPAAQRDLAESLLRLGRHFQRGEVSADGRTLHQIGRRSSDVFYRDRWAYDKVVRSTHGVNCTGSCSWKIYVKDGIITWEAQQTDYPSIGADKPEYEPRGCPRGAAFSWYTYSPTRVRYPYARAWIRSRRGAFTREEVERIAPIRGRPPHRRA
jgi:nitrate reductase / nitrite oxidoreductase, alpha subunit